MRVLLDVPRVLAVTLNTRRIAILRRRELVVPVCVLIHGMTRDAGQLAAGKALAFVQTIVFAAGDADLAIGPKAAFDHAVQPASLGRVGQVISSAAQQRSTGFNIAAGLIVHSIRIPLGRTRVETNRVTTAADLGGFDVIELRRINDALPSGVRTM